jgi:long-chain acyl-CoA synthetase
MGLGYSTPTTIYSQELPSSQQPGSTPIYRAVGAPENLHIDHPSGASTLYEAVENVVAKNPDSRFLAYRETLEAGKLGDYKWLSYSEVFNTSLQIGYALNTLNCCPRNAEGQTFLGIYAKNSVEWMLMDIACVTQNIASVPLYDVQKLDVISYIVDQTEMSCIATNAGNLPRVFEMKQNGVPTLRHVIKFGEVTEAERKSAESLGLLIYSLDEFRSRGDTGSPTPPSPDSIYTLCYTSGTTGNPKGVIITHGNMTAEVAGVHSSSIMLQPDDIHISYLPLAHMMERIVVQVIISVGAAIGFYGGDVMKIKEDMQLLKPTLFVSVPRLFNKFYDLIRQRFRSLGWMKKKMLDRGLNVKMNYLHDAKTYHSKIWDPLIFNKVKQTLGGNVRLMLTGSAPISGEVIDFLRVVFACPILEGYGQTESCAGSLVTLSSDTETGHCGGPIPNLEVKLVDVPEMKYFSTDVDEHGAPLPRGEICLRGPAIFRGYFSMPEETEKTIDSEGWLHTGDIGMRLPRNGAFKLIDRLKTIFKLAQGEYVAAESVEAKLARSLFVSQIYLYGDSMKHYLVAIVVPEEQFVRDHWCEENNVDKNTSFEELCSNERLRNDVLADLKKTGKEAGLHGYEQVFKVFLEHKVWTTDDLLTPTQKLKRNDARHRYQDIIQQLYEEPLAS